MSTPRTTTPPLRDPYSAGNQSPLPPGTDVGASGTDQSASVDLSGLAAATTYHWRVVAVNSVGTIDGSDQTFTTAIPGVPAVDSETTSADVSTNSATLAAEINPSYADTRYYFEYVGGAEYNPAASDPYSQGATSPLPPGTDIGSEDTDQPASVSLTGLAPATIYHWRVVATNAVGTTYGADQTFNTLYVVTGAAQGLTASTAVLTADLDPGGVDMHYHFEYGLDTSYGNTVPQFDLDAGSGTAVLKVSQEITGLVPGRTYHYRVDASFDGGMTYDPGTDQTFTTPAGGVGAWEVASVDGGDALTGVSCTHDGVCVGVDGSGNAVYSSDAAGGAGAWVAGDVDGTSSLTGVSCASGGLCVAVDTAGNVVTSTNAAAGAGGWTVTNVDGPEFLAGVSCPASGLCVAVDGSGNVLYSTDPTGGASAWTTVDVDGSVPLAGVSCPSTGLCVAVDAAGNVLSSTDPTGGASAWTVSDVDGAGTLSGVSCPDSGLCVAVDGSGNVVVSSDPTGGAGAWTTTNVDGATALAGVSCPSDGLCVAVDGAGNAVNSTAPTGGAGAWTPTNIDRNSYLSAVSCPTAGQCVAVDGAGNILVGSFTSSGSGSSPGTGSPPTGSGPAPAHGPSVAQLLASLGRQLVPSGKAARIATVLARGGLKVSFRSLTAGRLVIDWYEPAAKGHKRVLVATGKLTIHAAGRAPLTIKLTAAGKRLLEHALHAHTRAMKLTATGTFTPPGKPPIHTTKTIKLGR